jgi:CBS domain containing-hemolysin-like protein
VTWLWVLVVLLVVLGTVLAISEASLTRMTRVRALALVDEKRRNAATLERIEADPPRYLNATTSVMFCQNGSAILVAILAERSFGGWGITFVSVVFTVLYFVVVEAMAKTFGVPTATGRPWPWRRSSGSSAERSPCRRARSSAWRTSCSRAGA